MLMKGKVRGHDIVVIHGQFLIGNDDAQLLLLPFELQQSSNILTEV